MPFITIPWIHTADPSNIWASKSAFTPADPFAIVMGVRTSSDVVAAGLRFNAVFQMVNPRLDAWETLWYTIIAGSSEQSDTIDWHWRGISFSWGTDFAIWFQWNHYSDPISHILGPDRERGIFYVRGTIDVLGSNLFAYSSEFWYKVRPQ
jgi:hypothetical protein